MKKSIVVAFASVVLTSNVYAYDLKANMYELYSNLSTIQTGFISGNEGMIKVALTSLKSNVDHLLKNEKVIKEALPKGKEHMSSVAVSASYQIDKNIKIIEENLDNPRKTIAQNAGLEIQKACMTCHNIVRDR